MTVPPPVIAANRVLLMTLIATNFFGQNTPAIAATEAQYMEMWAQDAVAMYGYAAASATATELAQFVSPPNTTSAGAVSQQAAAVSPSSRHLPGAGRCARGSHRSCSPPPRCHRRLQQFAASPAAAVEPNFIWNTIQDFFMYGLPTPDQQLGRDSPRPTTPR